MPFISEILRKWKRKITYIHPQKVLFFVAESTCTVYTIQCTVYSVRVQCTYSIFIHMIENSFTTLLQYVCTVQQSGWQTRCQKLATYINPLKGQCQDIFRLRCFMIPTIEEGWWEKQWSSRLFWGGQNLLNFLNSTVSSKSTEAKQHEIEQILPPK